MQNQIVQLPLDVLNQLLSYLATRPYSEVNTLIDAVLNTAAASPQGMVARQEPQQEQLPLINDGDVPPQQENDSE